MMSDPLCPEATHGASGSSNVAAGWCLAVRLYAVPKNHQADPPTCGQTLADNSGQSYNPRFGNRGEADGDGRSQQRTANRGEFRIHVQ